MITVYITTYNEELLIDFAIGHYRERFPGCQIVLYDNMSTDRTVEIAREYGCEVISFDTKNKIMESKLTEIRNNCWKNAITDWVLICDADELIDIHKTQLEIEEGFGTTIARFECYDMINMEDNLDIRNIKYGVKSPLPGKFSLFNKKYIDDMNYGPGSHASSPVGVVKYSERIYKTYHYNSLGETFTIKKFKDYGPRLSEENLKNNWSFHYLMTPEQIRTEYVEERKKAIKVR